MSAYKDFDDRAATAYGTGRGREKKILNLLGPGTGSTILDVGCGSGRLGAVLGSAGHTVWGLDVSRAAVALASLALERAFVCDIEEEEWPVAAESVDVVIISEVVEHLFLPEPVLGKIRQVLKPGGRVIITTPNFLVFSNRIKMLFGRFQYAEAGFFDRGHIHFFTKQTLEKCLKDTGLAVVRYNNIYHGRIPEWLGRLRPSLFAYQFALVAAKNACDARDRRRRTSL